MMASGERDAFLFLSELLGRPVLDAGGRTLGRLVDLKVRLGEMFPRIDGLALRRRSERRAKALSWSDVESFGREAVALKPGAETRLAPLEIGNAELLLREDLLDKQMVDTFGAKIERANDIHLLIINRELRVVHVDFGLRGILRRLGWMKTVDVATRWLFAYEIPDRWVSWKYIQPLASDPRSILKLNVGARRLHDLHPSDLADILEELDRANRTSVFRALDTETAAETLQEVDPELQLSLMETTAEEKASDILEVMEPDEATDFLADLPEDKKRRFMKGMEKPAREDVEALLRFEEGTAGSIMTRDFLAFPRETTLAQAAAAFDRALHPLETLAYLYVTDDARRLVGVLTVRPLVSGDRGATLGSLMDPDLIKVGTGDGIAGVAALFDKYQFIALPVVDEAGVIQGIITLQDIVEARGGLA
jgi:magnesium transporter